MLARRPHVVIGTVVWLVTAGMTSTGRFDLSLVDVLLLLAPLVLVPIGLVVGGRTGDDRVALLRLAAAALLVPALLSGTGGLAGVTRSASRWPGCSAGWPTTPMWRAGHSV